MSLDFTRWVRKRTRQPLAHVQVRFSVDRDDLVAAAMLVLDDEGIDSAPGRGKVESRLRRELAQRGSDFQMDVADRVDFEEGDGIADAARSDDRPAVAGAPVSAERVTVKVPADPDHVFTAEAVAGMVGQTPALTVAFNWSRPYGRTTILAADLTPDGGVILTFDVERSGVSFLREAGIGYVRDGLAVSLREVCPAIKPPARPVDPD